MKKDKLKRRQYKYKVGSVVTFTDKFLNSYSNWRQIKKGDIGIVVYIPDDGRFGRYEVQVNVYRNGELYKENIWVYKGRQVHLISYNDAMIERL